MSVIVQNSILLDPEMKEIVESFIIESKEIIESLDKELIELERNSEDSELLNSVFRSFHTIKGSAGFLNLEKLTKITHSCEDILNKIRHGQAKLDNDVTDVILQAFDLIKELIDSIEKNQNEEVEIESVLKNLKKLNQQLESGKTEKVKAAKKPRATKKKKEKAIVQEVVVPELNEEEIPDSSENKYAESIKAVDKVSSSTIRVEIEKLDNLLNLVSELVLGRNRLTQIIFDLSSENGSSRFSRSLKDVSKQIDFITAELQELVLKTRMLKVDRLFNKYPRLVRDLAKASGKKVKLILEGENTEFDKTLIEEINDPLVHLIRNSIDHGVELPEERERKGKDPEGIIKLKAEHEGNNIYISIEDDGKGIEPNIIKEKAISKNILTKEKAALLSTQEILNLIFLPGFSTAEVVTNISGRGVGMDVVKTNVTKLRGIINIESTPGAGTKILLKLPITLAIISGMIVTVNSQYYVIPISSVIEVLRVNKKEIYHINQKPVTKIRERVVPIISLKKYLYKDISENEDLEFLYIVVVGIAEQQLGVQVDSLLGQKEVVIKSLGSYLKKVPGIAGSTIMGDGRVIMILDINELINNIN